MERPIINKVVFSGGLNSDDEQRVVQAGDYRLSVNTRIGTSDNVADFAVENVKGNTLTAFTPPIASAGARVIGAQYFDIIKSAFYFVFDGGGNHMILQYESVSNTITLILQSPLLNFDVNHKITGINLVNNELLYWTDDFNEPRKINITKAKANLYQAPFIQDYIYAIKKPPQCAPDLVYATDVTRNVNFLYGQLFQFKYRFVYDDYEKSAFSPITNLPLPALDCSDFTNSPKNNNIEITVETGSTIVTKIEIAARIGNTGDFFSIITIDKADPLNVLTSNTTTVYKFYNEKSYLNVSLRESNKLFDNLPKLAKSQDLIDPTRITYGDIVEGFDPVTPVTELSCTIDSQPNINTYNISGRIFIRNTFVRTNILGGDAAPYQYYQPIYYENAGYVFGGVAPRFAIPKKTVALVNNPANIMSQSGYDQSKGNGTAGYNQGSPLTGFIVYLAGTEHYAVSKQPQFPGINQPYGNGAISLVGKTDKRNFAQYMGKSKISEIGRTNPSNYPYDGVWSEFTIKGVPPGNYVLRVASNNLTQTDLDDRSRSYQKTSTYTIQVGGVVGTEISVTVGGSDQYVSDSHILDMTDPTYGNSISTGYWGYMTDADLPYSATPTTLLADTRIELAQVQFHSKSPGVPLGNFNGIQNSYTSLSNWNSLNPVCYTDHNGFFFMASPRDIDSGGNRFFTGNATVGNRNEGTVSFVGTNSFATLSETSGVGVDTTTTTACKFLLPLIIRAGSDGLFDNQRTIITGKILDQTGSPISGVTTVIAHGKVDETDSLGVWSIITYPNTAIGMTRTDAILYSIGHGTCIGFFTPPFDVFNIGFGTPSSGQDNFLTPYNSTTPYNFNNPVTVADDIVNLFGVSAAESALKRGGWYEYGIVYYDHANRSGLTNTNDYPALTTTQASSGGNINGMKIYIPFYTEINPSTGIIWDGGKPNVSWKIFHQPPQWATHYQWVRTKNMANNRFIQFCAKAVQYVDDSGNAATFNAATKINIDISNIQDYNNIHPNSTLNYGWIKTPTDDRLRLIKRSNGNFFTSYIDLPILGYINSQYVVVENRSDVPDLTGEAGCQFEIYNPKLQLPPLEQLYWEIDECYEVLTVSGASYHQGQVSDQSGAYAPDSNGILVTTTPAEGTFKSGDDYYRLRDIPITGGFKLAYIEDGSVSDFYTSAWIDIGRPNRFDPDFRETRRLSTIYYSELYIPETKINNLNSFYDTNFETYELKYGSIQKLYNENHRLICFQELKVGQIPVNQNVIFDNTNQNLVGTSTKVLNQIVYYSGEFGIGKNPESFAVYANSKYFVDAKRLAVLRLNLDGITPISEYKMHNFFRDVFAQELTNANPFIYGTYDTDFHEYVLAFENALVPQWLLPGSNLPTTVSFNEKTGRWQSLFTYQPDFMCRNGNSILSFKEGQLYTHNTNPVYDRFYNVDNISLLKTIFNQDPSKKKVFLALSEETPDIWTCEIDTPNGQKTTLIAQDFEKREEFQYAPLWFDVNTPNVANPLINGDAIRDNSILVTMSNDKKTYTKLFAVNIIYENSERSNK